MPRTLFRRNFVLLFSKPIKRATSTDQGSPDQSWKYSTNYFYNHQNKELYGSVKKIHSHGGRIRWSEDEELQVMKKEIEIKNKHPNWTEKEINQQLCTLFDHRRSIGSYNSRRKTQRWKSMIDKLATKDTSSEHQVQRETMRPLKSVDGNIEEEKQSENFWLSRQRELHLQRRNASLRRNYNQLHNQVDLAELVKAGLNAQTTSAPDTKAGIEQNVVDIGEILKHEVKHSSILEHGAKGMYFKLQ